MNFWKLLRVGLLSSMLLVTVLWAVGQTLSGPLEADWARGVSVAVVLLETGPIPADSVNSLKVELERGARWAGAEATRYGVTAAKPLSIEIGGPFRIDGAPALPSAEAGIIERIRSSWRLWRFRRRMDALAVSVVGGTDIRIYVLLEPPRGGHGSPLEFEGVAQEGRRWGLVRGEADPRSAFDIATAVLHETFHCIGATDKYDAAGHAEVPRGLVEPGAGPNQSRGELMVGEVPSGPLGGRLPMSFDELGIGPVTAQEIGWTK
ncbi:MAG: hypothetical protein IV100_24080 [Myxococcales bacterium]|nr:hypothetical protein [Myxococcales bacterium]